ncbi:hypothetical protein [Methylobacterium haplocladii]|uniref:Uncharacterized protein n=1 Tax=Methylobacterium haplocladii TaxID=1176176 RepID=A0A512IPD4_9HYPH|nr:hypothetical protein [Methylobacterium haplocladii]GEO99566.1 hypothetical protein MHA02_19540 [Methylobacterium haplocladii]GJD85857.1 hypothetical protein HPGCJGGD_3751 [Methylobacterium haplocladii]GLS58542.1 hypothetical protein GCM10007887_12060 [Methylobacterium haplocladii]
MPDPLDLVLATLFTAGCMLIHAFRRQAHDVSIVLVLLLIGLVNFGGALALSRIGLAIDPVLAAELVSYRPRHE